MPPAPDPPRRVWRDWALVGALAVSALLEGLLTPHVVWRPVVIALTLGLLPTLLWRRTYPLAMVLVGFGSVIVLSIATIATDTPSAGLASMIYVVLLPYALFRWGSGRAIVLGTVTLLIAFTLGVLADDLTVGDTVGGFVFLSIPCLVGLVVRQWTDGHAADLERVRLEERQQLARDLHDTVAHHVSAMVVRAQAGRVTAASTPGSAEEALGVIEAEGSRTLAEMRAMVGALRDPDDVRLAPVRGLSDIDRLARDDADGPRVVVHVTGARPDVSAAAGAAAYRIAQEGVTNALRHARGASRVDVDVVCGPTVRVSVRDDGAAVTELRSPGFGLVGMSERAALLGGTFHAGPRPQGGWAVEADLPSGGVDR